MQMNKKINKKKVIIHICVTFIRNKKKKHVIYYNSIIYNVAIINTIRQKTSDDVLFHK